MSGITGFAPLHGAEILKNDIFEPYALLSNLGDKLSAHINGLLREGCKEGAIGLLKGLDTPIAKHYLGLILLQGNKSGESSVTEALQYLQEANHPRSNYTLGIIYLRGLYGEEVDEKLALHYLDLASKEGDNSAKVALGYIYWKGICGVAASESIATQFIVPINVTQMVNNGRQGLSDQLLLELQQFTLDHCNPNNVLTSRVLFYGEVVDPIVRQERTELQISLADRLIEKEVGTPNLKQKIEDLWASVKSQFKKGETLPLKVAQIVTQLGRLYYPNEGQDEKKRLNKAISYWYEAADGGDIQAKYYLGLAFCSGKGVKRKDLNRGKDLLKQASDQGFIPATAMLNYLEKKRSERGEDKEILAEIEQAKSEDLDIGSQPEKDCIAANKSFLNKAWSWIKKTENLGNLIAGVIGTAMIVAAVVGVVFFILAHINIFLGILAVTGLCVSGVGLACGLNI